MSGCCFRMFRMFAGVRSHSPVTDFFSSSSSSSPPPSPTISSPLHLPSVGVDPSDQETSSWHVNSTRGSKVELKSTSHILRFVITTRPYINRDYKHTSATSLPLIYVPFPLVAPTWPFYTSFLTRWQIPSPLTVEFPHLSVFAKQITGDEFFLAAVAFQNWSGTAHPDFLSAFLKSLAREIPRLLGPASTFDPHIVSKGAGSPSTGRSERGLSRIWLDDRALDGCKCGMFALVTCG